MGRDSDRADRRRLLHLIAAHHHEFSVRRARVTGNEHLGVSQHEI
jgi:hypothetical protein